MTVLLTMRGELEAVELEPDFVEFANDLNIAGAKGKEFMIARTTEGDNIAIAMHNILTVRERA